MNPSLRIAIKILCLMLFAVFVGPAVAQDHHYDAEKTQAGYRIYTAQCQLCHGANGDGIVGVNLSRQQFPHAVTDDDIRKVITTGNANGMPPFALEGSELDNLVAFVRSGMDPSGVSLRLGDPNLGKVIYDRSGCSACHRIAGVGARAAPDLSDIGFIRNPSQMMTSLTEPAKATMPINRPITIVTNDGRTVQGRRFNEDTFTVQLIDAQEKMLSIQKSDIRRYDVGMKSDMPSYRGKLNGDEMADLLAYLVSLKGQ